MTVLVYYCIIIISFVLHHLFYCITWYSTVLYNYNYKYKNIKYKKSAINDFNHNVNDISLDHSSLM